MNQFGLPVVSQAWYVLAAAAVPVFLAMRVWPRRSVRGARAFIASQLSIALLFVLQAMLRTSGFFVVRMLLYQVWTLVAIWSVFLGFRLAVEYAGRLERTPGWLWIGVVVPLLGLSVLILTNATHGLVWEQLWYDFRLEGNLTALGTAGMVYACALAVISTLIFAISAARAAGEMRWQAALLTVGAACLTAALSLEVFRANPAAGSGLSSLLGIFALVAAAVAVLRFRAFDVSPVARDILVEQTTHGMMVLDEMHRVVDVNPAARRLLGVPAGHVIGRDARDLLGAWPSLLSSVIAGGGEHVEVTFADTDANRIYDAAVTPFLDPSGRRGLHLIVWFDVTETRAARAEVERQRSALVASVERERVARELHDGLAQALASINVRAIAARRSLEDERPEETHADLSSIIEVTRDANEEIRDFLVGAPGLGKPGTDLWVALAEHAERYRALHGIQVYLAFPEDVGDIKLDPVTQVQLLRIIQESLSNVRRHSGTRAASVSVARWPDAVRIVVHDDGVGFDPARAPGAQSGHLGLTIMRERADEVGARLDVTSAPGCGTAIFIEVPQNGKR